MITYAIASVREIVEMPEFEGWTKETLYRLVASGEVATVPVGKSGREAKILLSDLVRYIEEQGARSRA